VWLEDASGRVLLERRPPTGVWASLWSLPQFDEPAAADAWVRAQGASADTARMLPSIEHGFSHYHLRLHTRLWNAVAADLHVRDDTSREWFTIAEAVQLGLPAPIRKLLHLGTIQ